MLIKHLPPVPMTAVVVLDSTHLGLTSAVFSLVSPLPYIGMPHFCLRLDIHVLTPFALSCAARNTARNQ